MQRSPTDPGRARERLFSLVYEELRSTANAVMRAERPGHTLRPTALVHEAYLRLLGSDTAWETRAHFFGVAARAMRQILVDYARRRNAAKRGGDVEHVTLDEALDGATSHDVELVELNDALTKLGELDDRTARVVELRFFAGLNMREIASVLDVSERTVHGDWSFARQWLARELT